MKTALLEAKTNKWACPTCEEKRVITTHQSAQSCEPKRFMLYESPSLASALATDERMFHRCLNCGHGFSENENEKNLREGEKEKEGDQPWGVGGFLLILMLITILAIHLTQEEGEPQLTSFLSIERIESQTQR